MKSDKNSFSKFALVVNISLLLSLGILISCSPRSEVIYDTSNCIQDFEHFAFVIPEPNSERLADELPPPPWEIETSFTHNPGTRYLDVYATHVLDADIQIWMNKGKEYIVYSTGSKTSFVVEGEISNSGVFAQEIFVTANNEIWAKNHWWDVSKVSVETVPTLSKYNESAKEFEFVDEALALLVGDRIRPGGSHTYTPDRDIVALSPTSIFWIYNQTGTLYSFDPFTNHLQKEIEFPNGFRASKIQFLPNGSVVVQREFFGLEMQSDDLLIYDVETESLSNISVPEGWPHYDMYVDVEGRLWIGVIGSRSLFGEWTLLHPDIEDIFEKFMNYNQNWSAPTIVLESTDGRLWVKNVDPYDGITWYNPKTNTGCQFTTYSRNLVEDQNHTIWLVAEDSLYKLDIE